jgi:hypothetical protein
MGHVTYLGKNGSNPAIEKAKAEALALQNRLTRLRVEKLEGTLVEKSKVTFLLGNSLTILRSRILDLPKHLVAELRSFGLDHAQLHSVRTRLEERVHRFLCDLTRELEAAADPDAALGALGEDDDSEIADDRTKADRGLKREALNKRRREKRAAKAAR